MAYCHHSGSSVFIVIFKTYYEKEERDSRKPVYTESLQCTIYYVFTNVNPFIPHENIGHFVDEQTGSERFINLLKIKGKTDFQPFIT